jgi:hypothetical protein
VGGAGPSELALGLLYYMVVQVERWMGKGKGRGKGLAVMLKVATLGVDRDGRQVLNAGAIDMDGYDGMDVSAGGGR